jgi:hypothetical protein
MGEEIVPGIYSCAQLAIFANESSLMPRYHKCSTRARNKYIQVKCTDKTEQGL